jgi:hypothetical protein
VTTLLLTGCLFCWGRPQLRVFSWLLSLIEEVPYIHHDEESIKIMAKKVKKSWAYVKGHYRKNGTWFPPHLSPWRQLRLPMCVAGVVWAAVIYLLFGLVVLLALAVFSVALCICIIVGKRTLRKFMMGKVALKKEKESRLKVYEELRSKLKEAEIFENVIDMDKLRSIGTEAEKRIGLELKTGERRRGRDRRNGFERRSADPGRDEDHRALTNA